MSNAAPAPAAAERKRVGLVLGSGGARGYAHIGVIDALIARGYQIVAIAGTSMGAVVGGIHAAGKLDAYREWVEGIDTIALLRLIDPAFRLGAIQGDKVFNRIRALVGDVRIEDLPIEFTAVATDLTNQQELWFRQGSLRQAMRASAAIPSLFTPVIQDGRMLVDGALLNPLPITPVLSSRCDLIVAVNLNGPGSSRYELPPLERPPAFRERLDGLFAALETRLGFRRAPSGETETAAAAGEAADSGADSASDTASATVAAAPPGGSTVAGAPVAPTAAPATGSGADEGRTGATAVTPAPWLGPASLLELIDLSLEAMQNSLTQYKIAGYSPHVLINVPKRACRFFEFYRAPELIALGRRIADDTLDAWESEQRPR